MQKIINIKNIKNNNIIKNLLFIFSILLIFIVLRPILNYFNNKEYNKEYIQENFEDVKFWVQKDGLFKCKDGSYKKKCPDGYVTQSQGAAIHHKHHHGGSKKLFRYKYSNDKRIEKIIYGDLPERIDKLEKTLYKGEIRNGRLYNPLFESNLKVIFDHMKELIPFRNDLLNYYILLDNLSKGSYDNNTKTMKFKNFINNFLDKHKQKDLFPKIKK